MEPESRSSWRSPEKSTTSLLECVGLEFRRAGCSVAQVQIAFSVEQTAAVGFCKQKSRGWVAAPPPIDEFREQGNPLMDRNAGASSWFAGTELAIELLF
jgi:hypothetical protein